MKACVNCRFFNQDYGYWCDHPKLVKPDFVSGTKPILPEDGRKGDCGEEARYFEPRPPSLFKRLLRALQDKSDV